MSRRRLKFIKHDKFINAFDDNLVDTITLYFKKYTPVSHILLLRSKPRIQGLGQFETSSFQQTYHQV